MKRIQVLALVLVLAACAGQQVYDEGVALIDQGQPEQGLARMEEAMRLEPDNIRYRQAYIRERDLAVRRYLAVAENARQLGQSEAAEGAYRRALALAPDNARAKLGVEALKGDRRQREQLAEAEASLKKGDQAAALAKVRGVLAETASNREAQLLLRRIEERALRAASAGPQLSAALTKPVTLEFRDASLRQVFDLVSRSTGLNFIFDRDVRPDLRTTVSVKNSSVDEVLRFILVTNQLERKVLSANTLLVYPNTAPKQREYQDLVVKTFYLANTDAKTAASLIRTLVKTKELHIDEKLNLVVMRDTPDAVRMAERLIANQDLAEPEVMLEVEVMEVSRNALYNMGIQFPDRVSASLVGAAGVAGSVTLPEWLARSSGLVTLAFSDPFLVFNLRNTMDRANLLANPRIRVKSKDKAKIHIGDKVPVITTTSTSTGFVSESVTYLDVGLKLDVEPMIYLEDDVGIKIGLEVSNIVREIKSTSGTLTYQVGTRNAATTLRLKDGETQVLAGLISDEDRRSAVQIPGLGSIPVLGRLFGSNQDTRNKTEIVLLITPRVLRNLARPELRFEEFPGGTEAAAGAPPMLLQSVAADVADGSPGAAPAAGAPATTRVLLRAPASIPAGQEFTVQVSLETEAALRSGLLDFAFDPSRLRFVRAEPGAMLAEADKEAAFRANAPEALGRLNLSFTSKGDLKGAGELARITLQVVGAAAGTPTLRLEALNFTSSTGQVVSAQLPPPVGLSLTR
ncbi:MAG: secretin N-terminal domain-containing protein [Burkholderiales bacterium]